MEVRLVVHTPNPDRVCAMAARTCMSQSCPALDVRIDNLRHALDSGHESVAEHAVFTFQVEGISRACSHQLVRHRLASYSQQSQRYVNMGGFEYITPPSIGDRKIGSTLDPITLQKYEFTLKEEYDAIMKNLQSAYRRLVEKHGVPEEDARYILPNACTTNITITMNARELRHFFKCRVCNRAQWEIRELATKMLELCKDAAPVLFENAGASCDVLGYCPEVRSCGRCQRFAQWKEKDSEDGL